METDELPVLDPNIDYREVPPIHQKRIIAFINNFIMRTVSFLNTFAASCESRMMQLESKIERVEASLLILESQLDSVPWLDDQVTETHITTNSETDTKVSEPPETASVHKSENETELVQKAKANDEDDSRFMRFFKMVQFGVPLAAVKQKMEVEGLDPNILE